jgi:hypothetical protein
MNETYLVLSTGFLCIFLALMLVNLMVMNRAWSKIPIIIKIGTIPGLIMIVVLAIYSDHKELDHYKVVRHLEVVQKLTPKYVFGYDAYTVEFEGREILIKSVPGYTTDSAAVVNKVVVYRQVRLPIWGFIKADYGDELISSTGLTDDIKKGLKQAKQVELK